MAAAQLRALGATKHGSGSLNPGRKEWSLMASFILTLAVSVSLTLLIAWHVFLILTGQVRSSSFAGLGF